MNKVKLKSSGQIYFINADKPVVIGTNILVDSDGIIEKGTIICNKKCPKEISKNDDDLEELIYIRIETENDAKHAQELKVLAQEYLEEAKKKVSRHGLDMKILDVNLSFDGKKLTFYFSASGRIDFRSLVADMAGDFRKIIRLQQIGARDEMRLSGGFGKCGRELCCTKFLNNLESISLDMAESQDSKGIKPNMVTGCCGKLMCCLSFEGRKTK